MSTPATEARLIWLGGKLLPVNEAKINVLSPTSQFGANVFEGIRCYWSDVQQQLFAFRLPEHYARLKNSMKIFRMEDRYSVEDFRDALLEVVRANGYKEDIAVRQTVFLDGFGSWNSMGPVNMFVAPVRKARNPKPEFSCCVSSWARISDKNMSPKAKVGANYINSRMAQLEAATNGFDSAIFMNDQGKISEAPGSCLFIVRDGQLLTPPVSASILESITRKTIIEIARACLNLRVIERDLDRTDLYVCEEAFLCGSAIEIMPVTAVDRLKVGDGGEGPACKSLRETYLDVVRGKVDVYAKWLTPIY